MAKKTEKTKTSERKPKKQPQKAGKKQASPLAKAAGSSEKSGTGLMKKSTESKNKLAALRAKILEEKQAKEQEQQQHETPEKQGKRLEPPPSCPTQGYLHSILSLLPYYMLRFFVQRTGGKIRDLDNSQRAQLIETGTPVIAKYLPEAAGAMPEELNYIACLGVCGITNYEGRQPIEPRPQGEDPNKDTGGSEAAETIKTRAKPAVYEQGSATVPANNPEDVPRIIPGPEAAR